MTYFRFKMFTTDTVQVLRRQSEEDVWELLEDDKLIIFEEDGAFFLRASINHFSQGCLGKNLYNASGYYDEKCKWPYRPRNKEIEFVNATGRVLSFLVQPTTVSLSFRTKLAAGVGIQGVSANATTEKAKKEYILDQATQPQVLQVIRNETLQEPLQAGQRCPFMTFQLPECTGNEARVALMTTGPEQAADFVEVWDSRIVKHKTRVVILPNRFSPGMIPTLGRHSLAQHKTLVRAGLTAMQPLERTTRVPVAVLESDTTDTHQEEEDTPSLEEVGSSMTRNIFRYFFGR